MPDLPPAPTPIAAPSPETHIDNTQTTPLTEEKHQVGEPSIVRSIITATGQGCKDILAAGTAVGVSKNACWTTRAHKTAHLESSATLMLKYRRQSDLVIRIAFADSATVPKSIKFSHAPSASSAFESLGEVKLRDRSLQQLRHLFRLGGPTGVQRYVRLELKGHLSSNTGASLHKVAHLLVTGHPILTANNNPRESQAMSYGTYATDMSVLHEHENDGDDADSGSIGETTALVNHAMTPTPEKREKMLAAVRTFSHLGRAERVRHSLPGDILSITAAVKRADPAPELRTSCPAQLLGGDVERPLKTLEVPDGAIGLSLSSPVKKLVAQAQQLIDELQVDADEAEQAREETPPRRNVRSPAKLHVELTRDGLLSSPRSTPLSHLAHKVRQLKEMKATIGDKNSKEASCTLSLEFKPQGGDQPAEEDTPRLIAMQRAQHSSRVHLDMKKAATLLKNADKVRRSWEHQHANSVAAAVPDANRSADFTFRGGPPVAVKVSATYQDPYPSVPFRTPTLEVQTQRLARFRAIDSPANRANVITAPSPSADATMASLIANAGNTPTGPLARGVRDCGRADLFTDMAAAELRSSAAVRRDTVALLEPIIPAPLSLGVGSSEFVASGSGLFTPSSFRESFKWAMKPLKQRPHTVIEYVEEEEKLDGDVEAAREQRGVVQGELGPYDDAVWQKYDDLRPEPQFTE